MATSPTCSSESRALTDYIYTARLNSRYHRTRAAHYQRIAKGTNALTLVLGSSAAASILAVSPTLGTVLATGAALAAAVSLVYDPPRRWYEHELLAKRWLQFETDAATLELECADEPPRPLLAALEQKQLAIEADEPPVHEVVLAVCDADTARGDARWSHARRFDIGLVQRVIGTWFAVRISDQQREDARREVAAG